MAIYEYKCDNCGVISEFLDMEKEIKCKSCRSLYLKKQFSAFSVINKGGDSGGKSCCGMTEPCDSPKRCCGK